MSLIKGHPLGDDITIINNWYRYPTRDSNGKYDNGSMTVVYRDNVTGQKHHQTILNPKCRFYMAKPEVFIDHTELFLEESKLDKFIVPYKDQLKEIAKLTDNLDFYYNNIKSGNKMANRELYTNMRIFDADYDIENHYRAIFDEQYTNKPGVIYKSYFDIEVDSIDAMGDFPEPGECPINAVTIIDDRSNECHTFLLENDNNPLIKQFKRSIGPELIDEIRGYVREQVGGWKNEIRYGLDKLIFHFHFYPEDEEIKLIQDLFIFINNYQPDFVLAWNMAFDIPYIIARIKKLGYDPAEIMSHPDFEEKVAKYFIDERNYSEYAERGDFATISSYSVFIDQMLQLAQRRKNQKVPYRSHKLDDVGAAIAHVRKYDYHYITNELPKLPYLNYKIFVIYNILDTICQKCIEHRTGDINYIYTKCLANDTKYSKGHRQTVYLRNRAAKSFRTENDESYIIGCNVNQLHPEDVSFKGAFVADARKITDHSKKRILGVPVMIFSNLVDYDYKSLYPSTMKQMNIAPNTMIGFIDIPEPVYGNENRYNLERFVRGGSFLEDLQSHVFLEFGSRWFGLADYATLYDDVIKYLNTMYQSIGFYDYYNGTVDPFRMVYPEIKVDPFVMIDSEHSVDPFVMLNPMTEKVKFNDDDFRRMQYVDIRF